jgi:hypothetical protein
MKQEFNMQVDTNRKNGRDWRESIDSGIRYLLAPFVVLGWALSKFYKWTIFGAAAAGMVVLTVILLVLISIVMFSGITNFQLFPGIITVPAAFVIGALIIIGITRGAMYALDDRNYDETLKLHFIEPIKLKKIARGLLILVVIGFALFFFLKLITGR